MGNVLSFSNAKEMNGVVKVYSVYGLISEYQRMTEIRSNSLGKR